MNNQEIAATFEGIAKLLELQDTERHRVESHRDAAQQIRQLEEQLVDLHQQGRHAKLSRILRMDSEKIDLIVELLETGRSALLEHLQQQ